MKRVTGLVLLLCLLPARASLQQEHQHPAGQLGTVHFETTCAPAAKQPFNHAMALLHSFEFGPAIESFNGALKADPSCAMAHWGIAMSRWTNPFNLAARPAPQVQSGLEAITKAREAGAKSEREKAYIEAAAKLFTDAATVDQRSRIVAYEKAMATLAAAYPKDREASIFWALSLTASALPSDKTYANQLKAGALLEKLYPQEPDHPGITHYIIHSYDVPALADRAIAAARRYAKIAPAAPHALHMPSHTFTRVGAWQDSIETNRASADAARQMKARGEELHAMDYMAYAYLQTGQDKAVRELIDAIPEIAKSYDPAAIQGAASGPAGNYAMSAIPARWALEHRDWKAAASLRVAQQLSRVPYTDAITVFAKSLGLSQTGSVAEAREWSLALKDIQSRLTQANEAYWAEQVGIQADVAAAFVAMAEGKSEEALKLMRATVAREDATEKSAISPGPLAPARELLGEMLLQAKRPAEALVEFEATMKKEPNRFRGVYGAAKAASLAGDRAKARTYYAQLLDICKKADAPGRSELAEARAAVGR